MRTPAGQEEDYWDSVIEAWPSSGGSLWRAHSDAVNADLLVRWLPRQPGMRILKTDVFDEAVGRGLYPLLRAHADHVVGVDVSPAAVNRALRRYRDLDTEVADVRRLPFADDSFDVVISLSSLDHFDSFAELRAGLAEIRRVLTIRGELVVTIDNAGNPLVALRNRLPLDLLLGLGVVPYFVGATCGPGRLRRVLKESGFEVQEVKTIMHCPRLPALLGARLLDRRAARRLQRRYLRWLARFERLENWPTWCLTGYFVAARATKA